MADKNLMYFLFSKIFPLKHSHNTLKVKFEQLSFITFVICALEIFRITDESNTAHIKHPIRIYILLLSN